MRRMTVWKSCHGVCTLEACFFGGDLHGWWKLRALPTKTGILTCLTLLMRKFQRCWIHAERNILGYVRKNDRREIITDFKAIRQAKNLQDAKERLVAFSAKRESGYKRRIKNLFTFFSFPTAIRQTIYSTNLIESFNKSLKKMVRRKEQFPNEGILDRFVMTQVMEYNDKFENRAHRGFKDCHDTLDSMF